MTLGAAALALCAQGAAQGSDFLLRPADRVVFYGDSITDNGAYTYFVETFVSLRYPQLGVSFANAGVGGDRVTGGWMGPIDQRLDRDLFPKRPTVVTVMLGMNDGSYRAFDRNIAATYQNGYRHIVQRLKTEAPDARVWLLRPSPFDDVTQKPNFEGGYNDVLARYGRFVQRLAQQNGYEVVNLNAPFVRTLERAWKAEPVAARLVVPDRVHPATAGHLLMASEILKAWRADPLVAVTEIEWNSGRATTQNSTVSGWNNGSFVLHEKTLPMPIDRRDAATAALLKVSDIGDLMNKEILIVKGMPSGSYGLRMDKRVLGLFTADEFAKGIDLATLDTPMMRQARRVADLTSKLGNLRYNRWRQLEFNLREVGLSERRTAINSVERLEQALFAERRQAAETVPHQVQILMAK